MNAYLVTRPLTHAGLSYAPGEHVALAPADAAFHVSRNTIHWRDDQATALELSEAQHAALAKQKRCCF